MKLKRIDSMFLFLILVFTIFYVNTSYNYNSQVDLNNPDDDLPFNLVKNPHRFIKNIDVVILYV